MGAAVVRRVWWQHAQLECSVVKHTADRMCMLAGTPLLPNPFAGHTTAAPGDTTHVQGACHLVALWGVLEAPVHVPAAASQCPHAKGAAYVIQDSVWTWFSAVLDRWLLGLLLHRCVALFVVW